MKRAKRILALLLILVLGLALYPAAAMADPPDDGEATHKHNWQITYQKAPTCEEAGQTTWTCTLCGKDYSEYPPALGHDWDNGTVTRPAEGFTPAEITYTCKRDASHTEVREINPVTSIFPPLLGFAPPTLYSNTLRITQQPEGGRIARGFEEGHTMTVAAQGGEGDYTYVWHYTDNGGAVNTNALDTSLLASTGGAKADYSSAMADFYAAVGPLLESQGHGDWMPTVSPSVDPGPGLLGWRESGTVDCKEPSYTATVGNCGYYCVVWDSAGHHATSNTVRVEYGLSIRTQPKNTNLPAGGEAELICQAGDGTGNYTYTWMKADGGTAEGTSKEPGHFTVTETGDYYCVVSDGVESIESQPATVYEAEDLVPVDWLKDTRKWPEDSLELFVRFEGGTPPYHCEWTCGGETVKAEDSDTPLFTLTVEDYERYDCDVTDAMGQTAGIIVRAVYRELEISKQPEDCELPIGSYVELSVEVADGVEPITYSLRRPGGVVVHQSHDNSIPVTKPGWYYYRIEDSVGHWAVSDWALVSEPALRITDQTESAVMVDSSGVELFVKAEGGKEPYEYEWTMYRPADLVYTAGWFSVDSTSASCMASTPGTYYCTVRDKNGDKAYSQAISVAYDGDAPLITRCSQDKFLDYSENDYYGILLYCNAIPAQGRDPSVLQYQWKHKAADDTTYACGNDVWMSLNGSAETVAGLYYCVVTDTVTGKTSTSRIINVQVEMVIVDAGYLGTTGLEGSGRGWWSVTVKGGLPPYTFYVYEMFPISSDVSVPVLNHCTTINGVDGGATYRSHFPREEKYLYPRPGGGFKVGYAPTAYFFVIKDASDQTIETGILGQ